MSKQKVNALNCPACGGPIRLIDATCPSCGVGLAFNYAELFGVKNYVVKGRNAVLDATFLALLQQVAVSHRDVLVFVPTLVGDDINLYLREVTTGKFVRKGYIISKTDGAEYFICALNAEPISINTEDKLDGGQLYHVRQGYTSVYLGLFDGVTELSQRQEIVQWAKDVFSDIQPQNKPEETEPVKQSWNPLRWLKVAG